MTIRGLVLGGGGAIGIAWETGILKGLNDAGVDPRTADLIVGTSAGSVVGTQLALGLPLDDLFAAQLAPSDGALEQTLVFDPQTYMAIMTRWATADRMTSTTMAELGQQAIAAPTVDEERYLQLYTPVLSGLPWPERRLIITAIDAESGTFTPLTRDDNVPLAHAVAASCAVPGLFPPVTINERRYMDGGVRSGTSADLARECDTVLIVAPIGATSEGIGAIARRQLEDEVALLRGNGSTVEVVLPDAETLAAFGPDLMDPSRRADAAHAGVRQGQALAARLAEPWRTV